VWGMPTTRKESRQLGEAYALPIHYPIVLSDPPNQLLIHLTVGGATEASDAYSKCLRYEVVPSILYYLHITLPIYMYNELFPMKRIESFSFKGLPTVLHLLASKLQAPRTVSLHNTKINYFYF
jgi:hypothetical protein